MTLEFSNNLQFLENALPQLTAEQRDLLKRLSVFQGGALEYDLLAITDIEQSEWAELRAILETIGLVQIESLRDLGIAFPYIQLHPSIAALWKQLSIKLRLELSERYRQRYYELATWLHQEDSKNPNVIRTIAQRELANLLAAAYGALQAGDEFALEFVDNLSHFLDCFDLAAEKEALSQAIQEMPAPNLLNYADQAQQHIDNAQYEQAAAIYQQLLQELANNVVSDEHCNALTNLARCLAAQHKTSEAIAYYQQALSIAQQLEPSATLSQQIASLHTELADVLSDSENFTDAREHYQQALSIAEKIPDNRSIALNQIQLASLSLLQGNMTEAEQRYKSALGIFQLLNEPASIAKVWKQLGNVYQQTNAWKKSENAYRQAAKIEEELGDLTALIETWQQLAHTSGAQGKLHVSEGWHRKTINSLKDQPSPQLANSLYHFANLLQNHPHRLDEARQIAEESLAVHQTLSNSDIWTVYHLLANIAEQQQDQQASNYRQLARESYLTFDGMIHDMRPNAWLIAEVIHAIWEQYIHEELAEGLQILAEQQGLETLTIAIQQILNGERDSRILFEPLDFMEAATIHLILQGIDDPDSLDSLFDEHR